MVIQEANEHLIHFVWELLLHKMAPFLDVSNLQVWRKHLHDAIFQNGLETRELVNVIFQPHDNKHRDLELRVFNCLPFITRPIK